MPLYPMRRIERIEDLVSSSRSVAATRTRSEYRAHICQAALVASDLIAVALAIALAFWLAASLGQSQSGQPPYGRALQNLTSLGAAWHGWGSLLVVVCLLGYFGCRGHYTSRVPSWTAFGDLATGTVVAFACDAF